jgi:hypothetical protein
VVRGSASGPFSGYAAWSSSYDAPGNPVIAAAEAAGLQATACHDLTYRREESDAFAKRIHLPTDIVADALVGFPAVVVWDIAKP